VRFVGRLHANIAIVNIVCLVIASEIAANFYWVLPLLACHVAVKGYVVRFTRHNADEALPSLGAPHDLLRAAAQRRGGIVRMKSQTNSGFLCNRDHGS